jgi:general secretion pathway protein L
MAFLDSSFGIDFKQHQVVLTLLRRSFGKIRLVDYQVHPLPPEGQKEDWDAQIIGLINTFISRHLISKDQVSISIPREKVIVRFIKLPSATKENLRKVLEYEIPKYTPFEKAQICFDYCIVKEEKDWLHLFAAFVQRPELDRYIQILRRIGIRPASVQIASAASLNLFYHHAGVKEGEPSILLDITDPCLEMNLVQGGVWKESLHLSFPSEEREARLLATLSRLAVGTDSSPKPSVFVYGLDASEKAFPSLRESPQIRGVFPPPLNRIQTAKGVQRPDKVFSSIGVALRGLSKVPMDLNLLPVEMRRKVRQIGKPLFIFLVCLAFLLTLSWGWGVFQRYRTALDEVNAEVRKRKPEVEAIENLQRKKDLLGKEITEVNKIKTGEISKILLLEELTKLLPPTVWIWNLKYNGKEVEISGYADSATDLLPILEKSEFFEKVEFSAPVTTEQERRTGPPGSPPGGTGKEKQRFKIKMRLEGRRTAL